MIIVTGSNGFIGKNLINRLESKDILQVDKDEAWSLLEHNYNWEGIEKIYHIGAISSTTETDIDYIHHWNINYSIRLFKKAIEHKIPVVYASSASVYGNSNGESINPLNYYALSKATVDYWVLDNMRSFENIVGLRFFNVYGEGEENKGSQASPIHKFIKESKENGKIEVFHGSSYYERDFVWVGNVIDCMLTKKDSGIYDVGTSKAISFMEVANIISEKYGSTIKVVPFPNNLNGKYQMKTCAKKDFDIDFISVKDYVNLV
ncbi:MAG: NAD-dependent epimerase/dehydratase family protein [Methylococcales bacterium]